MAKSSFIQMYEKAEAGQRVFSVARADAASVAHGFWSRGYRVSKKLDRQSGSVTITLTEK